HGVLVMPGAALAASLLPWPYCLAVSAALSAVSALLCAYHVCKRWTVLAVSDEGLDILKTGGLLGPSERHVPRACIKAVPVGPASGGRRGRPTDELYVYLTDGTQFGLFCRRDPEELGWLATELRQALHVPAVAREVMS